MAAVESPASTPTRALAEYVAKARYEDLPESVAAAARVYILDSLANAIGGAALPHARFFIDFYEGLGGNPEATILATGKKVPSIHAAAVNSQLANLLDFDDVYREAGHPGVTVVPPALAVGEKLGVSGRELINAVVVGYEVELRVCDALLASQGWMKSMHLMATWAPFGAAMVAARLMKLNADQVVAALSHAAMSAPVHVEMGWRREHRPVTPMKHNYGWSAMGGVIGAELAACGLRGVEHVFESDNSFWSATKAEDGSFSALTAGLGEQYLTSHIGLKPYAACRQTHGALNALHDILADHSPDPRQVKAIIVESTTSVTENFAIYEPVDVTDVEFSIPPLVALTAAGFSPARGIAMDHLQDPLVQELMRKTQLRVRPDADEVLARKRWIPATVTLEMQDGSSLSASQDAPIGEPEGPMQMAAITEKFLTITTPVIGAARAQRLLGLLEQLETVENVRSLTAE